LTGLGLERIASISSAPLLELWGGGVGGWGGGGGALRGGGAGWGVCIRLAPQAAAPGRVRGRGGAGTRAGPPRARGDAGARGRRPRANRRSTHGGGPPARRPRAPLSRGAAGAEDQRGGKGERQRGERRRPGAGLHRGGAARRGAARGGGRAGAAAACAARPCARLAAARWVAFALRRATNGVYALPNAQGPAGGGNPSVRGVGWRSGGPKLINPQRSG
jgi:hypothetical protein